MSWVVKAQRCVRLHVFSLYLQATKTNKNAFRGQWLISVPHWTGVQPVRRSWTLGLGADCSSQVRCSAPERQANHPPTLTWPPSKQELIQDGLVLRCFTV